MSIIEKLKEDPNFEKALMCSKDEKSTQEEILYNLSNLTNSSFESLEQYFTILKKKMLRNKMISYFWCGLCFLGGSLNAFSGLTSLGYIVTPIYLVLSFVLVKWGMEEIEKIKTYNHLMLYDEQTKMIIDKAKALKDKNES